MSERTLRDVSLALAIAAAIGASAWPARAANPPASECLAASNAAIRLDNDHRFRQERTELLTCALAGCPTDIRKECIRRVDEVTAAIPTIVFEAKDSSGSDLSAVKVTMDREVLAERVEGIAFAVDPGAHTFTFEAAGFPAVQKRFIIRERQKDRLERVVFDASSATTSPSASALPLAASPATAPAAPIEEPSRSGANKVFAILTTGVGVAGVAAGTVFGLRAQSKRDEANRICPDVCGDRAGVDVWHDAKSAGNVSTIAFVVGGVGLVSAAVIWVLGKPESTNGPSAQVGLSPRGLAVRGRW
jgi:hypothetical protein